MLTMLLYVLIVGLVAALLFLVASAVFGRAEELGPLPEGTTETVLPAHDISGDDVRELRFQQVFRGYKAGEVDWALARLAARIDELETQLARERGGSPQHPESGEPVEQTGPGTWTGAHPAAEPPAGTPRAPGDSRIERPGNSQGNGSTEQNSGTSSDTPGRSDGMQSSLAGLTIGYVPTTDPPGNATGQIPWHDPAETGPWEPPAIGNDAGPARTPVATPAVSAGPAQLGITYTAPPAPAPAVSAQLPQPGIPFTASPAPGVAAGPPQPGNPFPPPSGAVPIVSPGPAQPGGPCTAPPLPGSAGPDGYPAAPGAYTTGQSASDEPAGLPPQTGSLALPPVATTPGQPGAPVPWPGQPGQTTGGQL